MEARSLKGEKGASLVEYALLVALIAVACIVAIRALGSKVSTQFSTITSALS
ncbi:MAG: Flp family type IVb pilin [SAR324 cluster bacterium]|uniref:Flp family type IVb pilin n=1 Tax=SAR324 cluster bacterium TaxID=2024889 RepID=A0A7X9FSH5_9DELT|nr:Flp family type IVb pilin [SAR324 cluster bacterium]